MKISCESIRKKLESFETRSERRLDFHGDDHRDRHRTGPLLDGRLHGIQVHRSGEAGFGAKPRSRSTVSRSTHTIWTARQSPRRARGSTRSGRSPPPLLRAGMGHISTSRSRRIPGATRICTRYPGRTTFPSRSPASARMERKAEKASTRTSRAMNDRGWAFADVLVSLAILSIALGFAFPAIRNLWRIQGHQADIVYDATEARDEDPWKAFR